MKTKVLVAPQVEALVKSRAPEPRSRITRALKALARNGGDVRPLEGRLSGYSRLRIGGYRVVFAERFENGTRFIDCVFAEARGVVYELFEKLLAQESGTGPEK